MSNLEGPLAATLIAYGHDLGCSPVKCVFVGKLTRKSVV